MIVGKCDGALVPSVKLKLSSHGPRKGERYPHLRLKLRFFFLFCFQHTKRLPKYAEREIKNGPYIANHGSE